MIDLLPIAKLYLAHPFDSREHVRQWELYIESRTRFELINPFYDLERNDRKLIDSKGTTLTSIATRSMRYGITDEGCAEIVERDVEAIRQSDGVIVIIDGSLSYGTIQEMVYAHQMGKPVYAIIANGHIGHPWLRYHYTTAVPTYEAMTELLKEMSDKGGLFK